MTSTTRPYRYTPGRGNNSRSLANLKRPARDYYIAIETLDKTGWTVAYGPMALHVAFKKAMKLTGLGCRAVAIGREAAIDIDQAAVRILDAEQAS